MASGTGDGSARQAVRGGVAALAAVALLAAVWGCGTGPEPPGTDGRYTGVQVAVPFDARAVGELTAITGPEGLEHPRITHGAAPPRSEALRRDLESATTPVEAVVRVLIAADGAVLGVKVESVDPPGSELAARYGDEIAEGLWGWRFEPARRRSEPVKSFVDLTFRPAAATE